MRCLAVTLLLTQLATALRDESSRLRRETQTPAESENPNVLTVNPSLDTLQSSTVQAKLEHTKQRTVAAMLRAQSAANQADGSSVRTQQLRTQNFMKNQDLIGMLGVTTKEGEDTTASSDETVASLKEGEALAPIVVQNAAMMAVQEVQNMLGSRYNELDVWRNIVLEDTHAKAKRAGIQAAEPYNKQIQVFRNRINDYQAAAQADISQARNSAASAQSIATGAQARQASGDVIGAAQDMQLAKSMKIRSKQLQTHAQQLQGVAVGVNNMVPAYIASAYHAQWKAEHDLDPSGMPERDIDVNQAFTPPPSAA